MEQIHNSAASLHAMGQKGYDELAIGLHYRLEDWDYAATQNATTTAHFKRGFGLTIAITKQMIEDKNTYDKFDALLLGSGYTTDEWAALEAGLQQND